MSMQTLTKNVDRHLYETAENWTGSSGEKVAPTTYFAALAKSEGIYPEPEEEKEFQQHYLRKFNVPTWFDGRAEMVKQYAAERWAVETFIRDQGIQVRGPDAVTVQKAFTVTSVQAIFPIFYDTLIVAGLLAQPLLQRLVADTVQVNSGTADHIVMNENTFERKTGEIGEWTRFPELGISATNAPITLKKWGGILKASDEAVRRARVPVFARGLERIGRQLANDLTDFGMDVLLTGDGNAGAATAVAALSTGNPTYTDLVTAFLNFAIGYGPTDLIATKESWLDLLTMPQFQDPEAGFRFQATGQPPTPLGLNLWRWDSLASSGWATTKMLMLQADIGLIQYQEGGVTSDSQRIVNGQWSEVATSIYVGFAIMDTEARRVLTGW